jgi:hypothetical protein
MKAGALGLTSIDLKCYMTIVWEGGLLCEVLCHVRGTDTCVMQSGGGWQVYTTPG